MSKETLPPADPAVPSGPALDPSPSHQAVLAAKGWGGVSKRDRHTVRVLHIINGEHYSGAERVQDLLAEHLPEFGYEVAFACVKPDRFPQQRQTTDCELYDVPMRSRFDFGVVRRLCQIVNDGEFRLVHAHTPRSALAGRFASARAGVPLVYHVHSPTSRDTTSRWRNGINTTIERLSLFQADALICVSESLGRHMRQQGFTDPVVTVVQNGVPVSTKLRGERQPTNGWQIGTVALFRPRKGLELLLDSLAIIKQQNISFRLRAVGSFESPDYEHEIQSRVRDLDLTDSIDWVGFTQDVSSELAQMDLFVLPSLFGEGLPMVVLEAMAAGVPVVGTRVEGVPEAIDHGVNGLIATPGDAADLARCLRQVVDGEVSWHSLRQHALATHANRFSALRMAENVAKVYDQVVFGS